MIQALELDSITNKRPSPSMIVDDIDYMEQFNDASQMLTDLDQLLDQLIVAQNKQGQENLSEKIMIMAKNAAQHVRYKDNTPISSSSSAISSSTKSNDKENVNQLLTNLNDLDKKLQSTFHDLQQRRRYVLGAMIRQMQYTVRRIRTNVSRMHTQLISVDNVATQVPLLPRPIIQSINQSAPTPEFTVQQMQMNKEIIQEIEQRLYSTSRKINDIVIRLNASLDGSNDVGGKIIADNNGQQQQQPSLASSTKIMAKAKSNPIKTLNTIIQMTAFQLQQRQQKN